MPIITANIHDITNRPDDSSWAFTTVLREGAVTDSIVTAKTATVTPVGGVLTVNLEPGYAQATYAGVTYSFTVPNVNADLWPLIMAGVAFPPDTQTAAAAAVIAAYLATHPIDGGAP